MNLARVGTRQERPQIAFGQLRKHVEDLGRAIDIYGHALRPENAVHLTKAIDDRDDLLENALGGLPIRSCLGALEQLECLDPQALKILDDVLRRLDRLERVGRPDRLLDLALSALPAGDDFASPGSLYTTACARVARDDVFGDAEGPANSAERGAGVNRGVDLAAPGITTKRTRDGHSCGSGGAARDSRR